MTVQNIYSATDDCVTTVSSWTQHVARFFARCGQWWASYFQHRAESVAAGQMRWLSDADLKDMGISRCGIDMAVRGDDTRK